MKMKRNKKSHGEKQTKKERTGGPYRGPEPPRSVTVEISMDDMKIVFPTHEDAQQTEDWLVESILNQSSIEPSGTNELNISFKELGSDETRDLRYCLESQLEKKGYETKFKQIE